MHLSRETVETLVRARYKDLFDAELPSETEDLDELRWNSLQATRFVTSMAQVLGVRLNVRNVLKDLTLRGIVDSLLESCGNAQ